MNGAGAFLEQTGEGLRTGDTSLAQPEPSLRERPPAL